MHNRATVYSSHTPLRRSTTAAERHRPKEATLLIRINVTQQRSPCTQVWKVAVGFQHNELLVSASNAVLEDGTTLPAAVGNGTVFAGFPQTDLKTAVETAGDLKQMQAQISLVRTVFLCGAAGCSIAVIDQAC